MFRIVRRLKRYHLHLRCDLGLADHLLGYQRAAQHFGNMDQCGLAGLLTGQSLVELKFDH